MPQNINLYETKARGPRGPRPGLSFIVLLGGVAGVTVMMTAAMALVQFQVSRLNGELRRLNTLVEAERAEAQKSSGAAARKADPQLEAEIAKLRAEVTHAWEAMAVLKGDRLGDRGGFAEYFAIFARQSFEGVWLTGFSLSGAGDIEIQGRALRADLVPTYVQRLGREDALAGRGFARLEIARPRATEAEKAATRPPYLEFSLATRDGIKLSDKGQ